MNIIDRYIAKIVLLATLTIFLVILSLDSFINFIRLSDDIGRGTYTLYNSFHFITFSIPSRIYQIFPFAIPIGSIIGLSYINSSSEIIAMRSSGISTYRIVFSVLKLGILLSIISFLIGEYIAPITDSIALKKKHEAIYNNLTLDIKKQFWFRDKNTYSSVDSVLMDKSLNGINIYTFHSDGRLKHSLYAKTAIYNGNSWNLVDVRKTIFEEPNLLIKTFPQLKWSIPFDLDLVEIISTEITNLSASDLYQYAQYLDKNNINSKPYYLQFWQKVTAPFSLLAILLFTFPFAISHNRGGKMGEKLLIGVIIGLVFHMANKISAKFALLFDTPAFLSAVFLTSITLIASLYFIKKTK